MGRSALQWRDLLVRCPGAGLIVLWDIVYCSKCNHKATINWNQFSKPAEPIHAQMRTTLQPCNE